MVFVTYFTYTVRNDGFFIIMKFTNNQHKLWVELLKVQTPNIKKFASEIFLEGFNKIDFPKEKIPSLEFLNSKINPITGWNILRTNIRYSNSLSWYQHLARKEFIVTDFLRSWKEFEFTHEPDMFHDIFGHLPFHMLPKYSELIEMFPIAFLNANEMQKEEIKKLAWFSYEFGLIRENGKTKVFGTGLISSIGELKNVAEGKIPVENFTIENVLKRDKAIYSFNEKLFIFDSLEELKTELNRYFSKIEITKDINEIKREVIQEVEMFG